MSFSDETLMAFADGELDDITKHEVELAMRLDPAIAEKVRRHQALRADVFGAFAATLEEDVPQRLQAAVRSGKVIHLDSVRQLLTPPPAPRAVAPVRLVKRAWSWAEWGALAATLVVGVLAGMLATRGIDQGTPMAAFDARAGTLTAQGRLQQALATQLASQATPAQEIQVGTSFVSRHGQYCRSFALTGAAGVACYSGKHWRIPVLADIPAGSGGDYRQAGSAMPSAVLQAVDDLIVGKPLDAQAEQAAFEQGWRR